MVLAGPQRPCRDIFLRNCHRSDAGDQMGVVSKRWKNYAQMASEETNPDLDWRDPTDPTISNLPRPLENSFTIDNPAAGRYVAVKCYRNVIFIWLFHTRVLLNWINDKHGPEGHGDFCPLCSLQRLATRFWHRDRDNDPTFDDDVDKFWRETHNPALIPNLDQENDAEEYMKSLLGYLHDCGDRGWARLLLVQTQCVKICKECSFRTQESENDYVLKGTISPGNTEFQPLCRTLQFSKSEKESCKNEHCRSKMREPKPEEDLRPQHEFLYGLLDAPPILVIHCQPRIYTSFLSNREMVGYLRGKITRLEHSMAFASYPNRSLDPNTMYWAFYHLYGVILREGNTSSSGHYVCAFEQRQRGRWLFFDDTGQRITEELTRSELDEKIDEKQKGDWRIFMLMYRRLFQVPIRLLVTDTLLTTAIALQESMEPKTEDVQEEFLMSDGVNFADDGFQEDKKNPETRNAQAELPTEQRAEVEADPDLSTSKPNGRKTRSRKQAAKLDQEEIQAKNANEQMASSQVEPSARARKKETRSKATKRARQDASDGHEEEKAEISAPSTKRAKTGVEASTGRSGVETRSRAAAKRARGEAPDADRYQNERTATSKPASKGAKTAKPSAQPGKPQTTSRAQRRK